MQKQFVEPPDLYAICCTLAVGRSHFEHRLALIVRNSGELLDQLTRIADGVAPATSGNEHPEHLRDLADKYLRGQDLDWNELFPAAERRRISLPTYPFERRRFAPDERTHPKKLAGLHPLVDQSVAAADAPVYRTVVSASLPFMRDHLVQGRAILPGACLIEMACAALSISQPGKWMRQIEEVVFLQPVTAASGPARVLVELQPAAERWRFTIRSEDAPVVKYAEGILTTCDRSSDLDESARFDRQAWLPGARQAITREALYETFRGAGVACGPFCQGIIQLWLGEDDALAELGMPASEVAGLAPYLLHPTILDGAFQTAMAWLAQRTPGSPVLVPFAVGEITRFAALPSSCFAYVRVADQTPGMTRLNIAVLDEQGRLLVRIRDFQVRALSGVEAAAPPLPLRVADRVPCYRPVWTEQPAPAQVARESENGIVLIEKDSVDFELGNRLARYHHAVSSLQIVLGEQYRSLSPGLFEIDRRSPVDFERLLATLKPIDTAYFLAGLQDTTRNPFDPAEVEAAQQRGVYSLLHLAKALRKRAAPDRPIRLSVVTSDVQPVLPEDHVFPLTAGLVGLTQTIARECPSLNVHLIDVRADDLQASDADSWPARLAAEAGNAPCPAVAYRREVRHVRVLVRMPRSDSLPAASFRKQGIYVILGGAGGLGMTVARYLSDAYQARVLLVGRSELSSNRQAHLAAMGRTGGEVFYQRADVTRHDALADVLENVRRRWGAPHGIIHAAMVLQDRALEGMDEAAFAAVLAPKVWGTVVAADLLRKQPLDFLAFFSSANAFFGNAGQANYAAGSTFQDAFATYLAREHHLPVKIINWGLWGEVGAVAGKYYIEKAAQFRRAGDHLCGGNAVVGADPARRRPSGDAHEGRGRDAARHGNRRSRNRDRGSGQTARAGIAQTDLRTSRTVRTRLVVPFFPASRRSGLSG